jgi:hypothetical protein
MGAAARANWRLLGLPALDLRRDPWRFAAVFSRSVSALLRARPLFVASCLAACLANASLSRGAHAQTPLAREDAQTGQWFLGAYYRHTWLPSFMLKPVFERGASISNEGLGLVLSHSSHTGLTTQIGLGYTGYHFQGAFNPNSSVVEDTEWVTSKLGLAHVTGSVLWPIKLHRMLTVEIGLGVDVGIVTGKLHRTEAYPVNGAFRACAGPLNPRITGPNEDAQGKPAAYCDQAYDRNGDAIPTSGASVSGAHYNDRETRVPPLMLVPLLPHLALRFEPSERVAIKLEGAFGLVQFWIGASVHIGFGRKHGSVQRAPAPDASAGAETTAVPAVASTQKQLGRVIGKLMEESTSKPIAHASVKNQRMFSAIQTDSAGLFVFENVEPGALRLELTHPDYNAAGCDTIIPAQGGDVNVHCFLRLGSKEGAISGQIKDQEGRPIAGARIEITGPLGTQTQSDASGLFALVDAPPGTYRLRVQSPGYLTQLIEIEVGPRDTALPQIILLRSSEPLPREAKP